MDTTVIRTPAETTKLVAPAAVGTYAFKYHLHDLTGWASPTIDETIAPVKFELAEWQSGTHTAANDTAIVLEQTGVWWIQAEIHWSDYTLSGLRFAELLHLLNPVPGGWGLNVEVSVDAGETPTDATARSQLGAHILVRTAGEAVTVQVFQTSGGSVPLAGVAEMGPFLLNNAKTSIAGHWVGPVPALMGWMPSLCA
jgi:hypothetical protein